jgi:hypothetical protein
VRVPRGGRPGGARRAGGGSIVLLVVVVLALWILAGINPLRLIEMAAREDGAALPPLEQRTPAQITADDERAAFLSVVLAETEDTWTQIFREAGGSYRPPTMVLYSGSTPTRCGFGNSAAGPFYCPLDERVYIDLSFFDMLERRFGAPGDFAQA